MVIVIIVRLSNRSGMELNAVVRRICVAGTDGQNIVARKFATAKAFKNVKAALFKMEDAAIIHAQLDQIVGTVGIFYSVW